MRQGEKEEFARTNGGEAKDAQERVWRRDAANVSLIGARISGKSFKHQQHSPYDSADYVGQAS